MQTNGSQVNLLSSLSTRFQFAALGCALFMLSSLAPALAAGFIGAASMNSARYYHTATRLLSGKVLITAGVDLGGGALNSTELYDPALNSWTIVGSLSTARLLQGSALLPSGKVLVMGGMNSAFQPTNSAEIFDPSTNSWTPAASLLAHRYLPTATVLTTGNVLIVGGAGFGGARLDSAELYDPVTDTWSSAGTLNTAHFEHSATLLNSGKVLVTAGESTNGAVFTSELYDPSTNSWSAAGSIYGPRHLHRAELLSSGQVLLTGGTNGITLADAQLYDPVTSTWSSAGTMSTPRMAHSETLLGSGEMLVVGGHNGSTSVVNADLYDPGTNSWSSAGDLITQRYIHTATLLASGKVLIAGGVQTGVGALASVELYDAAPPDSIAPTASPTQTPAANGAGWNNSDVTVNWNWADNAGGSGIDSGNCVASSTSSGEGSALVLGASCSDLAGNIGGASYTVKVDKTSPTVAYGGNAGSYDVDATVSITCGASDGLSGISSSTCSNVGGPAYSFGLGTHTYAASATDNAGNSGAASTTFTVVLTLTGFDKLIASFFGSNTSGANGLMSKASAISSAPNANAKAGKLSAFNNEVDAKIGSPLTAAQAAVLKQLAASL